MIAWTESEFIPSIVLNKDEDDDNDDDENDDNNNHCSDLDDIFKAGNLCRSRHSLRRRLYLRVTFINNLSIFKGNNDAPACHLANETKSS